MTITQLENFLYEIDKPMDEDNCVLTDDQIFHLAEQMYHNQHILIDLITNTNKEEINNEQRRH